MACGGIQFMAPTATMGGGSSTGGVGICGSQAAMDSFVQGVNQNLQLIANCYEEQFGTPLKLPGIPQVVVQLPGFNVPSMPASHGEVLGRVPQLGRSHIGNVLPMNLDGGQARSKYKYPASAGVRVPDWVTTVAGIDPLDLVFQAIFNNYAVIVTSLAAQGVDVPMPNIPISLGACGGDNGEPGTGDPNALVVQQQALDAINRVNELIGQILGVSLDPCIAGSLGVLPEPDDADCWGAATPGGGTVTFDGANRSLTLDARDTIAPVIGVFADSHPDGVNTGDYSGASGCTGWLTLGDTATLTGTIILIETNLSGATQAANIGLRGIQIGGGGGTVPEIEDRTFTAAELIAAGAQGIDFELSGIYEDSTDPDDVPWGGLCDFTAFRGTAVKVCNLNVTVNCGREGFADYPQDPTDTDYWQLSDGYNSGLTTVNVIGGPGDFTVTAAFDSGTGDGGSGATVSTRFGSDIAANKPKICTDGAVVSFNYAYSNNTNKEVTFFVSIFAPDGGLPDQWAIELTGAGSSGSGSATINVASTVKGQIRTDAGFVHSTSPPFVIVGDISLQITSLAIG